MKDLVNTGLHFFWKAVLENLDSAKAEEWKEEYVRIGRLFAQWAAWFVIFGAPLIMLSEAEWLTNSFKMWVGFRMFSSVVTAGALVTFYLLRDRFKLVHEFLFLAMAYSLYVNAGFWADCENGYKTFLFGQLCILVPTVLITLLRPVLYIINFFVHCTVMLLVFHLTCAKPFTDLLSSFEFFIFLILAVATYLFASYRYYLLKKNFIISTLLQDALDDAESKRQKSDELLLNILPSEVAQELKIKGESEAKQYDHVTIMFVDFVNFTGVSEELSPKELVQTIHRNFTAFDGIVDKYGIEKIKTIGDAYLAVAGLPAQNPRHAQTIIQAAIEIRDYMESVQDNFRIRIGINSGTVVAGIVGVKKFAFDIWGDAVNIAARMEQEVKQGKSTSAKVPFSWSRMNLPVSTAARSPPKTKGKSTCTIWIEFFDQPPSLNASITCLSRGSLDGWELLLRRIRVLFWSISRMISVL